MCLGHQVTRRPLHGLGQLVDLRDDLPLEHAGDALRKSRPATTTCRRVEMCCIMLHMV